MEILIDESGTFTNKGAKPNAWCVVAAYASPETEKRKYQSILNNLKLRQNKSVSEEIKLREIDENTYFLFLRELTALKGVLFCVATDSHLYNEALVTEHQHKQAHSILKNVDDIIYESGREALRYLSSQVKSLSPQLYVQLICQIQLMLSFVNRGISSVVSQRSPRYNSQDAIE